MSYPPTDPFAKNQPDDSGHSNPYAPPPSGSNPPGQPPAQGGTPYGQPSGAPQYGQPSDAPQYGQPPSAPPVSPYGQAPGSPYGAPGQNPYTPPPGNDGMALAAMICSIAGLVLCGIAGVVGLILGIVSLGRIKRTGAGGRGMAIAGIVMGGIAVAWWVIALATGVFSAVISS